MDEREKRKQIFLIELKALLKKGYITSHDEEMIRRAYEKYDTNLKNLQTEIATPENGGKSESVSAALKTADNAAQSNGQTEPNFNPTKRKLPVRTPLTKEQIRERNLTLILILGVSFLLLGGLILATTNWGSMNAFVKMMSILSVSILFLIMSYIARKLNIHQTAFAFTTLSALFLPIVVVCASYYQLLGSYLSLNGYGASLLGFIASSLFVLIYRWIAKRYVSRIFEGLSLLSVYGALCFAAYFVTHQLTAWLILINLAGMVWLAVLQFWLAARHSKFFEFSLKNEKILTQCIIGMNALLALIFWQSGISYITVTLILSGAFSWCIFKKLSRGYHAGYLFFYVLGFLQATFFANDYAERISLWTILLILYTLFGEIVMQRISSTAWKRIYTNFNVASLCFWTLIITAYNTLINPLAYFSGNSFGISLLSLSVIDVLLIDLTKKHREPWFPYMVILNFYLIEVNASIIYEFSLTAQLRALMLISLLLYTSLYLSKQGAHLAEKYRVSLPILTGGVFFISLFSSFTLITNGEWALWGAAAWVILLLTCGLKTGIVRKWAGHSNPAWLGIVLIMLFPETWPTYVQLVLVSVALLIYRIVIQRTEYRSYHSTILYTSGSFYAIGLLDLISIMDHPNVPAFIILCFGAALSVIFTINVQKAKAVWQIFHGVFTGAALLYLAWLLEFHGISDTWIILFIEASALGSAAVSILLKQKKTPIPYAVYYWLAHTLMLPAITLIWIGFTAEPTFPVVAAISAASYIYYTFKTKNSIFRSISGYYSSLLILGFLENIRSYWFITTISFWHCVSLTALIIFLFILRTNQAGRKTAFGPAMIFLGLSVITTFSDQFYWMIIPVAGFTWFAWKSIKIHQKYIFSHLVFLLIFLWWLRILYQLQLTDILIDALALTAAVELIVWLLFKEWRRILHLFILVTLSLSALAAVNTSWHAAFILDTLIGLTAVILLLIFMYLYRYKDWAFLPMVFLSLLLWENFDTATFVWKTTAFLFASVSLLLLSLWQRNPVFQIQKKTIPFSINYELITSFIYLLAYYGFMANHAIFIGKLSAACLSVTYCLLISRRSTSALESKLWLNGALILLLWPAAIALEKSPFPTFINNVLFLALLLLIISVSSRRLWNIIEKMPWIEWSAAGLVYLRLMLLALFTGGTWTLLTFAIVALVGTIIGFLLKYKAYFFVGIVSLLISLLYNRRHIWIELPWWFYLVIGGFALITLASGVEWNRQDKIRRQRQGLPPRTTFLQRLKSYLSSWH